MRASIRWSVVFSMAVVSFGQGTMDQFVASNPAPDYGYIVYKDQTLAQSFRPSASGYLTGVDLDLARHPERTGTINVLFCRLAENIPSGGPGVDQIGEQLFATTIPMESIGLTFSRYYVEVPERVLLTADEPYAIVVEHLGGALGGGLDPLGWRLAAQDYSRGACYISSPAIHGWVGPLTVDMAFATYMSPIPEPSQIALGIAGLIALLPWISKKENS